MTEKSCEICGAAFDADAPPGSSPFLEAGELLAQEVWKDAGRLCPRCLESRALLTIMYDPQFS
jgi:hypothetical protein